MPLTPKEFTRKTRQFCDQAKVEKGKGEEEEEEEEDEEEDEESWVVLLIRRW